MGAPTIHSVEYHRDLMAKREVDTILAGLAQDRAEMVSDTMDLLKEVRQNKQNRYYQINKDISETHVEKASSYVNTFVAGAQILVSFVAQQSPLAAFVSGLKTAGEAATNYMGSAKQSTLQTLNHTYQDWGGLISEMREEIRQKMDEFKQSMQDKSQALHAAQRVVETMFSR